MKVKHISSYNNVQNTPIEVDVDQIVLYELIVPAAIAPSVSSASQFLLTDLDTEAGKVPLTSANIVFISAADLTGTLYSTGDYGESGSFIKLDSTTKTTGKLPFNSSINLNQVVSPTLSEILPTDVPNKVTFYNTKEEEVKITVLVGVKL